MFSGENELRETLDLSRHAAIAREAARDAGDALEAVNNEVLTDENIDSAVGKVEDTLTDVTEPLPDALMDAAREAMEEKGLTGDAAREYIRKAGDALGEAGETVLTDENVDAAMAAVQKEMTEGAASFLGDGSEAKAGREAIRNAADDNNAATRAAVGALVSFLARATCAW